MEMWLKCATLALLTAALLISAQAPVILDGQRRREEVPLGSPVTLHCRLNTDMHKRFRVSWFFNQTFHSSDKLREEFCNKSTTNGTKQDLRETCLEYTLSNATQQKSGWYYCCVTIEIPTVISFSSNGTEIIFTPPSLTQQLQGLWMWIWLGVSAVVLLVLLVLCVFLRRKYRRHSVEDPIYANTRNRHPSPRPEANNLKTDNRRTDNRKTDNLRTDNRRTDNLKTDNLRTDNRRTDNRRTDNLKTDRRMENRKMENLKVASSFQPPQNPSPRRKFHEDKRRYK